MASDDSSDVTDEEMVRDFKVALHQNLKAGRLGATALVSGLKAIQAMIPPPPPADPDEGERFSILDQLPSLPDAEGRRLVVEEIARLREDLAAHEAYLEMLEVKR